LLVIKVVAEVVVPVHADLTDTIVVQREAAEMVVPV
jgi:hypothetical protein